MNLLIITLCVLIKTMMILAIDRLSAKSTTNIHQYVAFTYTTPIPTTPTTRRYHPTILHYPRSTNSLYNYTYNIDTSIEAQEEGHFNNVGSNQEILEAQGSYNYSDNKGNTFEVSYIANENGFQPEGAHLPTTPPLPPLIKKALQYIVEHPEKDGELGHNKNINKIGKLQTSFDTKTDQEKSNRFDHDRFRV
ncbi:endocuticle structural glycoprotein SgAbd-2-like isoform X2 [Nylanderia fulva]|uniref:endocuticle structural glycoprotein SgAbd-2-like isoform X2 n=1 Tax=Nylanderia fulva TaxID=613905 RepID=UPI0010FB6903|nr:endocuticle structural glycoprotein SgAbd-2-like isoform X2 [Nylanderia fulva]